MMFEIVHIKDGKSIHGIMTGAGREAEEVLLDAVAVFLDEGSEANEAFDEEELHRAARAFLDALGLQVIKQEAA